MQKLFEKLQLNQNFKAILNYCFRVLIFLFLMRDSIVGFICLIFISIVNFLFSNINMFDEGLISGIIIMFIPFYIIPKICGLYKKLDNLNIFLAIIVILSVDILYSFSRALTVQLMPLHFSLSKIHIEFFIIWFFFIYKFLNFLTKIFPVPFKQIGYIFSIDLWKDIYRDVKKDIEENYLKKKY